MHLTTKARLGFALFIGPTTGETRNVRLGSHFYTVLQF